jgi:hypothetical protein
MGRPATYNHGHRVPCGRPASSQRIRAQLLATAAPPSSSWLPGGGYMQNFWETA